MVFAQMDGFLFHPEGDHWAKRTDRIRNRLCRLLGKIFALFMGLTAISIVLGPAVTGKPRFILPRITVLLIFGLLSMILVMREARSEEGED